MSWRPPPTRLPLSSARLKNAVECESGETQTPQGSS